MGKRRGFIDVDTISENLSVEQVAAYFGVSSDAITKRSRECRTRCFLQCGKSHETGDTALAIQAEHPAKVWKCHDYDCGKQGNLVSLVSLAMGLPVRPRGDDFKRVARMMQAILDGSTPESDASSASREAEKAKPVKEPGEEEAKVNVPLADADNERVRSVAELYRKLTVDVTKLNPAASKYVRLHKFLTEEVAADWQLGYLSRSTGEDRIGGTMRGKFVIAIKNAGGEIVGYAGRDPEFETKHEAWVAGGREGREPAKWTFPKTFYRGIELYAQDRLGEMQDVREKLRGLGLPVVEGALDAVNVWETLDQPCVAILSNLATNEQLKQIAKLAHEYAKGVVTLLYDCDEQGERGMDADAVKLSKLCRVQRAWSRDMYDGKFTGRQPSELKPEEWEVIEQHLER